MNPLYRALRAAPEAFAEEEGGHHGCGYEHLGGAVLLAAPMASLLIGAMLAHFCSRFAPWLPYTPALALIGIIIACIAMQQGECAHMRGSVEKWVDIEGHAMLFIFLPPLLFADTMQTDFGLFKVSLGQCMLLASTGVLAGAFLHALYGIFLPYDWDLMLALAFGSVQAATDPVAVVSLLGALGAPATLTMIISGESLLNDGSAIVVWNVAFYSYLGEGKNPALYAVELIFGGIGIGLVFWAFLLLWFSMLNRKRGHTDGTLQVAMTVFAAYTNFYVAEAICGVSGVLAVVTMGVGLSATFWPFVCSKETMQHTWHIFEWILNTLLFMLAGLIIGARLVSPMLFHEQAHAVGEGDVGIREWLTSYDVALAVLTWVIGCAIRGVVLAVHFPALQRLGYGMTKGDAAVCWWGGLHGGVGLALAMTMESELREAGQVANGMRVLLHVSVAAMLTLLVNAPLMAPLLRKLGLTSTAPAKQAHFKEVRARVSAYAWAEYNQLLETGHFTPASEKWKQAVPTVIHSMNNEQPRRASLQQQAEQEVKATKKAAAAQQPVPDVSQCDTERLYEIRLAFLNLVSVAYGNYLEEGVIPASSSLAVDLDDSIAYAKDQVQSPLQDWYRLSQNSLKVPLFTRLVLKYLRPLSGIKKLRIWLVHNGPDAYAERVAFALTAFIAAHNEAQEQMKWMFGQSSDELNIEQNVVCAESRASVARAEQYLDDMHKIVHPAGDDSDDVLDYVKARQVAGVLLHSLSGFIERLEKNGVLEGWMSETLLHEVEHDEVLLRTHLKKIMGKAGTDAEIMKGLGDVAQLHSLYLALMDEEGVDMTKKTIKEQIAIERENLKKVKALPGQRSAEQVAVTFGKSTQPAAPRASNAAPGAPAGPQLPAGWTAKTDVATGRDYYVNGATGETHWTLPA